MALVSLGGALFREMLVAGAAVLEKNRANVDALNVFPVPDGDTGTNMSLTMMFASKEAQKVEGDDISKVAEAAAKGALKGARGNSGVMLSQLLRGFSKCVDKKQSLTTAEFAACLKMGSDMAYRAVMRPREGTILTVARTIAEDMLKLSETCDDFEVLISAMLKSGEDILRKTPDMLPVLKQAGVVDAGGKGLLVIYTGYKLALDGEEFVIEDMGNAAADTTGAEMELDNSIEFGYCTEFFIRNIQGDADDQADKLREKLMKIGDCVLVVGDSEVLKVHVHSNHPGQAIEYGLAIGTLHGLKIDNMREQHNTIIEEAKTVNEEKKDAPREPYAFIAVASGEGIANVFTDLGVKKIVLGGQTMNPPTEDFIKAIEEVHAENVYILPNNSNIIMAAQQAADLEENCNVKVLPTKTIPQGMSAVLGFMPDNSPEDNYEAMVEAFSMTKSGKITYAVRDSEMNGNTIHEGDVLGMSEGDIVCVGRDIADVTMDVLATMADEDSAVITVFYGSDVSEEDSKALLERIQETYPDCDVEMLPGGQPVYYYIFSVE